MVEVLVFRFSGSTFTFVFDAVFRYSDIFFCFVTRVSLSGVFLSSVNVRIFPIIRFSSLLIRILVALFGVGFKFCLSFLWDCLFVCCIF